MLILAALSVVRLALLASYVALVIADRPWWGVPVLVVFAMGIGCNPPAAVISPKAVKP